MNKTHRRISGFFSSSLVMGLMLATTSMTAHAEQITVLNSDKEVQAWQDSRNSDKPVLVEFFEDGCGWCAREQPVLDKLSDSSQIEVVKINAPRAQDFAAENQVSGYPTLVLMTPDGKRTRWIGYHNMSDTQVWLKKHNVKPVAQKQTEASLE
jgi:thiol-disulfide isomerase/thioredoxin